MTKIRILFFIFTASVVTIAGFIASLYATGYRINPKTNKVEKNGILVVNIDPTSTQILINGDIKGAGNSSISLPLGAYDLELKKDGFFDWTKRI